MSIYANLGLGVGLRNQHFSHILDNNPQVDWFEAISENFMDSGGRPRYVLNQIAERYPVVLHGVSMSIRSTDPLDFGYLTSLKRLADEINAQWLSDHLCWTGIAGINSHDLLPLQLSEQTLTHVISRVNQAQDALERELVLENPSTYVSFHDSTIREPEFLNYLTQETGCKLLLDVNNVYVTCFNADQDPYDYLADFPFHAVVQMHLAGHQNCGDHIVDTHDQPVHSEVWKLFSLAWRQTGTVSTLLEWDGNVPEFENVHQEALKARHYMTESDNDHPADTTSEPVASSLSTPIDFLVPSVMSNTHLGQL